MQIMWFQIQNLKLKNLMGWTILECGIRRGETFRDDKVFSKY